MFCSTTGETRRQAFQNAPLEIQSNVQRLVLAHNDYQDMLLGLASTQTAEGTSLKDGRDEDDAPAALAFQQWESEEDLKASATIIKECKVLDKGLRLLCDSKGGYYFLSPSEDYIVDPGTHIGSVGGGCLLPRDAERKVVIPWTLPHGDKTRVQLVKSSDDETQGLKDRLNCGTLYAIVRELEGSATTEISMTSFGRLLPKGDAGRHSYDFEFKEGHDKHDALEFVPTPSKEGKLKVTAANFFVGTVDRTNGIASHGALEVVWRMTYNAVGNILKPQKPSVVTKDRISLPAGKPVLIAWQ